MSEKYYDKDRVLIEDNRFYEHPFGIVYISRNEKERQIVNTINKNFFELEQSFSKNLSIIEDPQDKIKNLERIAEWMKEKLKDGR